MAEEFKTQMQWYLWYRHNKNLEIHEMIQHVYDNPYLFNSTKARILGMINEIMIHGHVCTSDVEIERYIGSNKTDIDLILSIIHQNLLIAAASIKQDDIPSLRESLEEIKSHCDSILMKLPLNN